MPKKDEITSTEKLLDAIRSPESSPPEVETDAQPPQTSIPKKRKTPKGKILSLKKGVTIGVDLGPEALRLVKVKQSSERRWELLDYQKVPYEGDLIRSSPQFAKFLKNALVSFNGSLKNVSIWSSLSAANVDVYNILIPKISKGQVANAVYWTVKKDHPFDEKEKFLDFQVQKEVMEKGIPKLAVLVYTAPKSEVKEINGIFSRAGIELEGISITPFANQNLFKTGWLETGTGAVGSLYIGRDWSRIDIFSEGNLVLTRDIKTGLNSMIQSFVEAYNDKLAAGPSIDLSDREEQFSLGDLDAEGDLEVTPDEIPADISPLNFDEARGILNALSPDSEAPPHRLSFSDEEVIEFIGPALERLIRQAERTFEHYTNVLGNERVDKIFVAGGIEGYRPIIDYIGEQLGIDRGILDPMDSENPFLGIKLPPRSLSERIRYTVATGIALSDESRTPNLNFTHEARDAVERKKALNRRIRVGFSVLLIAVLGYYLWQGRIESQKEDQAAALNARLNQYEVVINKDLISRMSAKVKKKQAAAREYIKKYGPISVINEITKRTPPSIKLTSAECIFKSEQKGQDKQNNEKGKKGGGKARRVDITGFVFGPAKSYDQALTTYVINLEDCRLFGRPKVEKTAFKNTVKGEALSFELKLDIEE